MDYYEAEISIDELAAMIFEDLGLPNLEEKRQQELETEAVEFMDIRKTGILPNLDKRRTIMREHQAQRGERARPASATCAATTCASRPGTSASSASRTPSSSP